MTNRNTSAQERLESYDKCFKPEDTMTKVPISVTANKFERACKNLFSLNIGAPKCIYQRLFNFENK